MPKQHLAFATVLLCVTSLVFAEPKRSDIPQPYRDAIEQKFNAADQVIADGPFDADWSSLKKVQQVPTWFRDAKFGIYFHWGVYSVPAHGNEWYPRQMHLKNHKLHKWHLKNYGNPTEFGYHDFVPRFTAKQFDPEAWAKLFKEAGARFAGPVAEHHDGFSLWDSEMTPWNAVDRGPKRDLTGELAEAIRAEGMRLVTSFHHARNHYGHRGNVPEYAIGHYSGVTAYYPELLKDPEQALLYGYVPEDQFLKMWEAKLYEVIDKYQPSLIWFDSWLHHVPDAHQQRFLAYYFNRAKSWGEDVVVTRKQDDMPLDVSVEDFEKGRANKIADQAWLTDDTISRGSWCYTESLTIKPTNEVVDTFIDIVSKNGQLLLNISPKANGTIPENQQKVLRNMGDWLDVNGEAIYGTRPWATFGEGPTRLKKAGHFLKSVDYTSKDIRYTRSRDGETLYAIAMAWPGQGPLTLESVAVTGQAQGQVTLLGYDQKLEHQVNDEGQLVVTVPELAEDERPSRYAHAIKIDGFDFSCHASAPFVDK